MVPDLAAQVARANLNRVGGPTSWWTGWFGGLSIPDYSILVPQSMATLGVRTTGVLGALAASAAAAILTRDTTRPRAGAIAFAVMIVANLVDGRVTFTVGLAFAAWSLVAIRARRNLLAVALATMAYGASPLAGLLVGLLMLAIALTQPTLRRGAAVTAATLVLIAAVMITAFPGTGTMPFHLINAMPCVLCCVGVIIVCPTYTVRCSATILLLSVPVFLLLPSAVGTNITRLAWVCAAPTVVACGRFSVKWLVLAVAMLASWPLLDLSGQIASGRAASSQAAFYGPLAAQLTRAVSAAPGNAVGERVEVVDTANHWGSVYLSASSLARGWDRQADHAYNPMFYQAGQLNAATYYAWLKQLAVGWVALPSAKLDYASVAEGQLVSSRLPYLTLVWENANWHLYRVLDPSPLAINAHVENVSVGGVAMSTTGPTTVHTRVRWSPYLTVVDPVTKLPVPACVANVSNWAQLYIPRAETFELTSRFTLTQGWDGAERDCVSDLKARG